MESRKSFKAYSEPNNTLSLQIGFIFSLAFMLLLLELMSYFSIHETNFNGEIEIPVEMGMAKEINQITLQQQQSPPTTVVMSPSTNLMDAISNSVIVSDDIALKNGAELKADNQEGKISGNGFGTNGEADVEDPMPFTIVEDPPIFPGGTEALLKFLGDHIKYPLIAKTAGISGTVIISFVVEKDGSVSNVKVVRGIGGGCNEEAVHVVSMMPKWTPGKQRGKAIRTQFQVPLVFSLHAN